MLGSLSQQIALACPSCGAESVQVVDLNTRDCRCGRCQWQGRVSSDRTRLLAVGELDAPPEMLRPAPPLVSATTLQWDLERATAALRRIDAELGRARADVAELEGQRAQELARVEKFTRAVAAR